MRGKNTEDLMKSLQAQDQLARVKLMERNKKLTREALLKEKWSNDELKRMLMSTDGLTLKLYYILKIFCLRRRMYGVSRYICCGVRIYAWRIENCSSAVWWWKIVNCQ